jgi:hypothetical protein
MNREIEWFQQAFSRAYTRRYREDRHIVTRWAWLVASRYVAMRKTAEQKAKDVRHA